MNDGFVSYKETEVGRFIDETKGLIDAYLQKHLSADSKKLLLTCKTLIFEFEKDIILPFDKGNVLPVKHPFKQSISDIGGKLEKITQKLPNFDNVSEDLDPFIFEIRLRLEPLFEASDYQTLVGKFFNLEMIKNISSWLFIPGAPSSVEELNKTINVGYYRFQNELFDWLDIKVMAYVKKQILVEINEKASFETLGDLGIRRLRKLYSKEYPEFLRVLNIYDLLMKYKKNPYHDWHNMKSLAVNDFLTSEDTKNLRFFIETLFKRLNIPLQEEQEKTEIIQETALLEEPQPEQAEDFFYQDPDEEERPPENDEEFFEDLSEETSIVEELQIYEEPSNEVKPKIDPFIWLKIIIELNACLMEKSFFSIIKDFITASDQTNHQEYLEILNGKDINKLEESQRLKINKKLEEWIATSQELHLSSILKRAYLVFNPDNFPVLKNKQILTSSAKALRTSIEALTQMEGLPEEDAAVCKKLSEALKSKLWLFLNSDGAQDPAQIHQFKKEFKILLRSQEDTMANHRSGKRVITNVLLALTTFCVALLVRAAYQAYKGQQITLFADKTRRRLQLDVIEEVAERFCESVGG